jgi:hypothetical protein
VLPAGECIAGGGERGEVKHLSTRRSRKQIVIPLVVASERGGWLNRMHVIPGGGCVCGVVGCVSPCAAVQGSSEKMAVLVEVAWDGLS